MTLMTETDLRGVAIWLRRLPGQKITPMGFPPLYMRFIRERQLAHYHEWPGGHWALTEAGRDFIQEYGDAA